MKTSDHQTQSKAVAKYFGYFVFFFIACALVYHVCQLSQYVPFHDWDEAIYAQVSKEWVRHPGFTLTYNGSSWFEKPPLPSLLYSLAWLIPQLRPEFVARLISAFISFITLIFVYKIIYWLTDKVSLSLLAVFVTLQSALFLDRSVLVNVDIFLALGWVGYLWAIKTKSSILKLAFTLIGTLSKSLLGFFPLIAEICIDCLSRSINREKIKVYLLTVFAGLSWQIFMIVIYGQSFIQSHFIDHMVSRVTRPIELHFGDKFFYGVRLWQESHIWLLLALGGTVVILLLAFYQLIKRKEIYIPKHYQLPLMMLFIFVGYFSLLTISKSKIHWYITPLIPLVCMGAIYVWHIGISYIKNQKLNQISQLLLSVILLYCGYVFISSVASKTPSWYTPTDETLIGQCIGSKTVQRDSIVYIVPTQERIDANVIEAAQLQIGSSFIYGSAPAFLYYANVPVKFVYKLGSLTDSLKSRSIVVIDKKDILNKEIFQILVERVGNPLKLSPLCETQTKVAYRLP